jgi:hypothetical protein
MKRGTVNRRKLRIGLMEEQGQVCSREDDGLGAISLAERLSKPFETLLLLFRTFALADQFYVGMVDVVHLLGVAPHELYTRHHAEEI